MYFFFIKFNLALSILILLSFFSSLLIIADDHILKSRILKNHNDSDLKILEKEINFKKEKKEKSNKGDVLNNESMIKEDIDLNAESVINKNKIVYKILYIKDNTEPNQKSFDSFVQILPNINREKKITIISFSSINPKKTTSDARRLSLSRALLLRKFLIKNNFPNTNILIKAMGGKSSNEVTQDIILLNIN